MTYNLGTLPAATYYVHFRQASVDSAEDSFWYGFDGVAQPVSINQVEPQTWKWETSVPVALAAGAHTLHVWMREDGSRIDVIVLSTSATQP